MNQAILSGRLTADPKKIYRELVDIAPDGCLVGIAEKGKVFHLE